MRKVLVLGAALLATVAFAQIPRFAEPVLLTDNGTTIDVGYYGAPQMFDWDLDGRKDLVLGQFTSGYIRFYSNVGEDSAPAFSGFEYLRASGAQITLPSG
ncbi:hypothetical protein JXB37_04795 [candidate division WOR-3 bacterium]|nr:hypothetical protein [candidate division WOR-3 bacterium]